MLFASDALATNLAPWGAGGNVVRHHRSYLVRWWKTDRDGQRIELLHIQSGAKTVVATLADAMEWMNRGADVEPAPPIDQSAGDGAEGKLR